MELNALECFSQSCMGLSLFMKGILLLPNGNTLIRFSPGWTDIYKVNYISFIKFPPFFPIEKTVWADYLRKKLVSKRPICIKNTLCGQFDGALPM